MIGDTEKPTYLRRPQAAAYLQEKYGCYSVDSLAKLACIGGGPVFRKIGKFVFYTAEDLDDWMESRMSPPISQNEKPIVYKQFD